MHAFASIAARAYKPSGIKPACGMYGKKLPYGGRFITIGQFF
jgi:hypothetical protein